jgi:soluble lytic murein transglycosylase-like protein
VNKKRQLWDAPVDGGFRQGEDVRALLRSRWVQGILGATVVLTVAGKIGMVPAATDGAGAALTPPAMVVSAVAAEPGAGAVESANEAWRRVATERESQRLAAEYVNRGYRVSPQLAREIHDAALRYEIDPQIAFGLVRAESSFRNSATSHVGATGLTQLMPRTAAWIAPGTTRSDLRDPQKNLDVGFRYLRYLLDKYDGDVRLALLAYNRGPGTVDRVLRRGGNPDNGYVEMVMGTRSAKRR